MVAAAAAVSNDVDRTDRGVQQRNPKIKDRLRIALCAMVGVRLAQRGRNGTLGVWLSVAEQKSVMCTHHPGHYST